MVHPTLHIIASCTDRKRAPVEESLRLRSVISSNVEERARLWWERLNTDRGPSIRASELYAGGHWASIRDLPSVAKGANFEPKLWVISAGYGFVPATTRLHPYSATFSTSNPDAVYVIPENGRGRKEVLQTWWNTLGALKGEGNIHPSTVADLAREKPDDYFLVIASPDYLLAIEQDLLGVMTRLEDPERLVIVSSNGGTRLQSLEGNVVPSDARLQKEVGGVLGSIHARVARRILENAEAWGFTVGSIRQHLLKLIEVSEAPVKFERARMNDEAVREFIREALGRTNRPSCSVLLRELRGNGRACEQSRFKTLYNEVKLEGTLFPV